VITHFPGSRIDQLMCKLSTACYAIRAIKPLMFWETLRMIYFSYAYSVMTSRANPPIVPIFFGYKKDNQELLLIPEYRFSQRIV
jgi:hypothetical protein